MTTLALVFALALTANGGNGHHATRDGGPAPAAQVSDSLVVRPSSHPAPAWNLMPTTTRRGQVWANVGFGAITDQYDADSKTQALGSLVPLPSDLRTLATMLGQGDKIPAGVEGTVQGHSARVSGQMNVINVHVGGSYDVLSRPGYSLSLGADLGLSQQNFQAEQLALDVQNATVSIPAMGVDTSLAVAAAQLGVVIPQSLPNDARQESGFKAQSLSLFAGLKNANIAARAGYQFDIGPNATAADQRTSTDRQDAILLGVSGRYPLGKAVVFASAESFITLNAKADGVSYDLGDLYGLNGGIGYNVGFGEIGAALTFRYRTDGHSTATVGAQSFSIDTPSGYQFGIAPYVTVSPGHSPVSLYVKGGVQDEYRDYSLSITGENDLAPHLGATFGLVYGF